VEGFQNKKPPSTKGINTQPHRTTPPRLHPTKRNQKKTQEAKTKEKQPTPNKETHTPKQPSPHQKKRVKEIGGFFLLHEKTRKKNNQNFFHRIKRKYTLLTGNLNLE